MKTLNTLRFVAPCFATCAKIVSRGRLMHGRTHHIDFPMALPLRLESEVSCIGDRPVHISAIREYEFRIPRKYESVSKGFF